ncbi:sensor histidine kinase [Cohnella faecalis]|uniref:sensor histidine kinase n=1 Tax=Cohnella faecalis TaxID=2315694 RepID=UPI001F420DCB|nr:HAMP domain-containing sensor histidine kinase [Cohnella faecalis]
MDAAEHADRHLLDLWETVLLVGGSVVFFIVYMVLLNWRRFLYVEHLNRAVEHIANGNFNDSVPVRQRNEVSVLAENTNMLVEKLKRSLDDERRAEQTKNELITNVSHDLRTPLTSIIGYLGLIDQDRYRDEVELRHYVQIAHAKAERLNALINDLFEYTRMNSGVIFLRAIPFNLVEMMNQLVVHYRLQLEQAGLEGQVHSASPEVVVQGDPEKLVRVFENLLANAMQYGKDGKKVDIHIRKESRMAVIEVVNYGEPIPPSDLPYLFDRFYRIDKSRTEHAGGSGLGLAIVKSLVEKHDGMIQAESDSRRTVFRIKLPLPQEAKV